SHLFINENDGTVRVGVLTGKTRGNFNADEHKKMLERLMKGRGRRGPINLPPGLGGPGGGMPGGGAPGGPGGAGGVGGGGGPGGGGLFDSGANPQSEAELKYVTMEEFTAKPQELAETLLPVRMAVVVGAFPYKAQVEEFKRALRLQQTTQLLSETYTD